ncbi:acyl-CoA N-acyltransferase [Coprinopsis marcescibilis]|uniref:Acyl-CoA N-acyltransferase n=1 Tax=Coprinopsis marcescibilis TaxID=230819 RepID=A0A5C3L5R3_COPMA|nr:acyl-CoA N-acyltransferase [Coprinopsis marcescibilis]
MSFFNSYKASEMQIFTEPAPGPYDINFNTPLPEKLETDKIRLVPFVPSIHAKHFHTVYNQHPELGTYFPFVWTEYSWFLTMFYAYFHAKPEHLPMIIIDRTKGNDGDNIEESMAGMIGYMNSDTHRKSIEIGPVIVFPSWKRTFVSSHAIGLLMNYAMNLPEEGGLGLRKLVWTFLSGNEASLKAAQRMGFKVEGTLRWFWEMPEEVDGEPVDGQRGVGKGKHEVSLSVCWDDWEKEVKELVHKQMNRQS